MFERFFQPRLSRVAYEDLKYGLVYLIWSRPQGLDTYASGKDVPKAVAASLLDFCLTDEVSAPLTRAKLDADSVAFLRTAFDFTGWTWLKKQGAITQVTRALAELIETEELEVFPNGNNILLWEGGEIPGHTIRAKAQPLTAA